MLGTIVSTRDLTVKHGEENVCFYIVYTVLLLFKFRYYFIKALIVSKLFCFLGPNTKWNIVRMS